MTETSPPAEPPAKTWRRNAVAVFVTWHLFSTLLYILPYPPYLDDRAMNHPEVKREMELIFKPLHVATGYGKDWMELRDKVLGLVRVYTNTYFKCRKLVEWYMDAANIQQSWNMFGGTPPHFPRVLMVEIRPVGEAGFTPFKDYQWGSPNEHEVDFRQRKTHEILGLGGWDRQREEYANHYATLWNREHPDKRAFQVRFYYWQLTTPPPEKVRAGDNSRHPERVMEFTWLVPPEVP